MGSENHSLHIFFFPYPAHGHMIPTVDMARLFAARGVRATIVTTPLNLSLVSRTIGNPKTPQDRNIIGIIDTLTIRFPCVEAGLPEGCENADSLPSPSLILNFHKAARMLQHPLEQLLLQHHPHCLIADMFFPWATDSAAKFGIPRIVFHGTSSFSQCATALTRLYQPQLKVSSHIEPFVIPNLPGEIKITKNILPKFLRSDDDNEFKRLFQEIDESELRSFGVVVNSFYELDGVYANHNRKVLGRKTWQIGPVCLSHRDIKEKANRGKEASIDEQDCLKWLDSKNPNSTLYICFGSMANFTDSQLKEIALALEASGQNFVWVVRKKIKEDYEDDQWLPEGFEKRMEGKGLIIRGWAPQVLILEHEAIGGFVTHCGWNSTLEGVSAGVPMVTWPLGAEQFYNEKFVTEVVRIGVPVGVKEFVERVGDSVKKKDIENAIRRVMVGEEAEEMTNRAKKFMKMAKKAVEERGSSYSELNALIQELESRCYNSCF